MFLEILTPEKKIFEGEVNGINLPGASGGFELLNNHAPIISALDKGTVRINSQAGVKTFEINSGFVECLNNKVTVLVEGASAL
jgi:F-type H+-transporting ATPase subunit epsilon